MKRLTKKHFLAAALTVFTSLTSADVKVSNLQDFNFGLYPGAGRLEDNKNICTNAIPKGRYQIIMFGDGSGGRFEISNGIDRLPYRVFFNDHPRTRGGRRMRPGRTLIRQQDASDQLGCTDGLNANIRIRIRRVDLASANPGRYRGTLSLIISPE